MIGTCARWLANGAIEAAQRSVTARVGGDCAGCKGPGRTPEAGGQGRISVTLLLTSWCAPSIAPLGRRNFVMTRAKF
jgi:hypothetical protein